MARSELVKWIKEQRVHGYNDVQLQKVMLEQGYFHQDVEDALNEANIPVVSTFSQTFSNPFVGIAVVVVIVCVISLGLVLTWNQTAPVHSLAIHGEGSAETGLNEDIDIKSDNVEVEEEPKEMFVKKPDEIISIDELLE